MWDFIKQNWGNLASVLGLIISLIVLWYAKRASEAAQEAKEAVLKRVVADDLQEAVRRSEELLIFLRMNEWKILRLKADELDAMASWLISRWGEKLGIESRNHVILSRKEVRSILEVLDGIGKNSVSEKQRRKLLSAAKSARQAFVEAQGRFVAKSD